MADAYRDSNFVPTLIASSNVDGKTPVRLYADPVSHRLLVDLPVGSGTVSSVSVVSANGFAGTVATATTTPAITLSTTITGLLKGNGTAISAASDGTDYLSSTTGITVSQSVAQTIGSTGSRLTKLWATDITVTNAITGSITGNAATVTTNANLTGAVTSVGNATSLGSFSSANLSTALTDETGTGVSVFNTKPTFIGTINTIVAVAALALDGSLGSIFTKTIGTGSTFTQSNFSTGQCFMVTVTGAFTVTWFAGVTWITSGAAVPTQGAITTYGFICTGSNTFQGFLVGTQ